ncbi:MAG: hypothetical protein CMA60_00355 [Euryarchaeota archaeon]|nr:hypothetical protein [Euryarchaeota archaeon]
MWRKRKHVSMIVEDEPVAEPVETAVVETDVGELIEEMAEQTKKVEAKQNELNKATSKVVKEQVKKTMIAAAKKQTRVIKTRLERTAAMHVNDRLDTMESLLRAVFIGTLYTVYINSGPGIGKTHAVMEIVKELGLKEDVDYIHIKGSVSAYGLYKLVVHWDQIARQRKEDAKKKDGKTEQGGKGKTAKPFTPTIVLDDVSGKGEQFEQIMKGLGDSYPVRTITWMTDKASMDPEEVKKGKLPHKVDYTGGVIILSNDPINKIDKPLMDRSMFLHIEVTDEEMVERMRTIASGPKFQPDMDPKLKMKVLDWICSDDYEGSERSMRTLVKACQLAQADPKNWRRLVQII